MPGNILWQSGAPLSVTMMASGQGVSLANTSITPVSGIVYNNGESGALCFVGIAELISAASGAFGGAVQPQLPIDFYLVPIRDGTTPATASISGVSIGSYKGSFTSPISGNPVKMSMVIERINLLPIKYQGWIQNNTGQTLSSGWSLVLNCFQEAYT